MWTKKQHTQLSYRCHCGTTLPHHVVQHPLSTTNAGFPSLVETGVSFQQSTRLWRHWTSSGTRVLSVENAWMSLFNSVSPFPLNNVYFSLTAPSHSVCRGVTITSWWFDSVCHSTIYCTAWHTITLLQICCLLTCQNVFCFDPCLCLCWSFRREIEMWVQSVWFKFYLIKEHKFKKKKKRNKNATAMYSNILHCLQAFIIASFFSPKNRETWNTPHSRDRHSTRLH